MPQTWNQILDFPAGIRITNVAITAQNAVGTRVSPYSYRMEKQVFSGQRMRMKVDFHSHDPETGSILESFLLKLRGSAGVFRFGDPYHSLPMGQDLGFPVVSRCVAGEQILKTSGWFRQIPRQLIAGDYIQIKDRLYRVLEDVDSDESGRADVMVWPNLRETVPAGTKIKTRNPVGLWSLERPEVVFGRRPVGQKHLIEPMACVEVR